MKSFLFYTSIVTAIALTIAGHFYYQQKLNTIAEESVIFSSNFETAEPAAEPEQKTTSEASNEVSGLLKEWTETLEADDALAVTIFGSTSVTNDQDQAKSWPTLFEATVNSTYQDDASIVTTIVDVDRTASTTVLGENYIQDVVESNPDILLFEPFILNDNSAGIRIEDSLEALSIMLERFKRELPDTTILLMPANPIYGANFYLTQIEQLESFASEQDYLYVDHWGNWPSIDDSDLNNYIENGRPTEEGHVLWAEAIVEYVTAE
jgi:hypothetical protein